MRSVVVYEMVSLDGVAESPHTFFAWDDEVDRNMADVIATQDTIVLGRRTYDEWAPYWPTSDMEPFATFANTTPKIVATSTPLTVPWDGAARIDRPLVDVVRDLREQPGRDIGVHGSVSVANTLLAEGLVDTVRLVVSPTAVGTGRGVFDGIGRTAMSLRRADRTPSGVLLVDYDVLPAESA